jgi:EmrB/QacA subfamily drug resistance transporter
LTYDRSFSIFAAMTATAPAPPRTASRLPLLLACCASFLAFLDVTITNLAVPDMARDFGEGVRPLSWVVTLYTIPFAALLAPAGRLADVIGRRQLFAAGVSIFTAASLLAAAAPDLPSLLVARAAQGLGAALLMPASLAFVLADTPAERRPAAVGLWSASAALAAALGPALGGVLVNGFGWRALFCINLPLGVWMAVRSLRVPVARAARRGRLPDVPGTVLLTAAVALLVLALTEADVWGWGATATIACLAGALVAARVAFVRSAHHPSPAVEVGLWRNRTYAAANVVSVLFGAGLLASLLLGVLFLVQVWGYSELEAGLAMTPGAVAAAAVGLAIGRSGRAIPPRALVAGGGLLLAAATGSLALWLPAEPHFVTAWLLPGLALGAGVGAVSVGVSSAAALSVAPARFAAATGLNIAARQVGGAVGVAVLAAVLDGARGTGPFLTMYAIVAIASLGAAVAGLALGPAASRPAEDGSPRSLTLSPGSRRAWPPRTTARR